MLALLGVALALAGPQVAAVLGDGEERRGELVQLGADCTGTVRDAAGELHHMGTERLEALWFLGEPGQPLPTPAAGEALLQVQALATGLTLGIDGARFPVEPGQLIAVPPGRHRVQLSAPGCGRQLYVVEAPAGVLTPLVFNRPKEQQFLLKAAGVAVVWGGYLLVRIFLPC